ncbi:hypothetical protein [Corynebacterium mayonis]
MSNAAGPHIQQPVLLRLRGWYNFSLGELPAGLTFSATIQVEGP